MNSHKKQGLMHGAMILAIAGMIVKVIGALFKIPLGAILGPEGMANFSIAYNIYALLFVLSTAGVPVAVSKMIAEECALHRYGEVRRIFRVSLIAFAAIGAAASLLLFFGADFFARIMGSEPASAAIAAIAPAIFFVSIASICRGYYQGHSNMIPTACSEVIEALGKLLIGLSAAFWLSKHGYSSHVVAAGAVLGVSVGALASAVFLLFRRRREDSRTETAATGRRAILKRLLSTAVPITIGASIISLTNVIDSAIVMNLLQKIGYSVSNSMWLYGAYNYATTIFNLPGVVVTTLGVSLIPAVAAAAMRRDSHGVSQTAESSLRIAMLFAIPAALGLFALGEPVVFLLYGGHVEAAAIAEAGRMLSVLALAIPFLAVSSLTGSILQALGNVKFPVISMGSGALVKVLSNWILVGIPQVHIYGACISTLLCYVTIAAMNAWSLAKRADISISFPRVFFGTTLCGLLTGVCAKLVMDASLVLVPAKIAVILSVLAGIFACALCTFIFRVLTREDFCMIFGEKRITNFLKNH